MKRLMVLAVALVTALTVTSGFAVEDDISLDGIKKRETTEADCTRLLQNGKKIVELRDDGVGLATVTAILLKVPSLRDRQYRITLPILLNFTTEAYGAGKALKAADLLAALNLACHSDANHELVYF